MSIADLNPYTMHDALGVRQITDQHAGVEAVLIHMRAFILLLIPALLSAGVIAACKDSGSSEAEAISPEGGDALPLPPTTPQTTDAAGATTSTGTGLPCEIQGILENRCLACHSTANPPPLVTYANLTAPSIKDPAKTMAVAALELMKAKAMPPAPAVPPEDDELADFEDWLKAGTPINPIACTNEDLLDGGVPSDGGFVDGGDGGTCTSGKTWAQGNIGSELMHPGAACNACHQQAGGPNLRIAGTVYPTLHEPIDCNGSAPPPQITVTITDSRNKVVAMQVNAAGNFSTRSRVRPPLKATLSDGVKTRVMNGAVTSGDCNSCHTQAGVKNAPGRILAP